MSNITCVLDACSIINLIHIDEDDILIKRLKYLNIIICERVFKEVKSNAYKRLTIDQTISKEDKKNYIKIIDQKINIFRKYQVFDNVIINDLGNDFIDQVKELSKYSKNNGELYSSALSLYKSRLESTKLFFHTDDFPAKDEFSSFFATQQIGHIEDTSDLLLLLYSLDDNFKNKELEELLSKLQFQYTSQISILTKKLREYQVPRGLLKDFAFRKNLSYLIDGLSNYNFDRVYKIKDFFINNRRKYKVISDLLKDFDLISDLGVSDNLVNKIIRTRKELEKLPIYKL